MRRFPLVVFVLAAAVAVLAGSAGHLPAAASGAFSAVTVENGFPDTLTFKATVSADTDLARVEVRYTILPDGTDAFGGPTFGAGKTATVEFELKVNDPPRAYFPSGSTFRYYWWAEDMNGTTFQTDPVDYLYLDNRFEWQPIELGSLTLYFHSGSQPYAEALAQVGNEGLQRTGALLGVTVPFPVRVFLYNDPDEMVPALSQRSEAYSERVVTGGVRVSSDLVFVAKGFDNTPDTLRHELAHVVTKVAGVGAFGDLPTWLDEGTAVYAQSEPGEGYEDAVNDAIANDRALSLRAMGSQPNDPGLVNLAYGQAWSVVKYLVDTYGQPTFAQFFAEFKKGATPDDALTATYQLTTDGLDAGWRAAHGLPERPSSTPTTAPSTSATPGATLTPFVANPGTPAASTTAAPNTSAPAPGAKDGDANPGVLVALAAAGVALVILLVAGGFAMRRRGSSS